MLLIIAHEHFATRWTNWRDTRHDPNARREQVADLKRSMDEEAAAIFGAAQNTGIDFEMYEEEVCVMGDLLLEL
jgi:hypothetical protein